MFGTAKGKIRSEVPLDTATIIGAQTTLRGGNIHAVQDLRIDGAVEADVRVDGRLVIGRDAEVEGTLIADELIVLGLVRGSATARRSLVLKPSSVVFGRVEAPSLSVEDGASGEFSVRIGRPARPGKDADAIAHPDAFPTFVGDGANESTSINVGVSVGRAGEETGPTFRPTGDSESAVMSNGAARHADKHAENGTTDPEPADEEEPAGAVCDAKEDDSFTTGRFW